MTTATREEHVVSAGSIREAIDALADAGDRGMPLAGATWVTRQRRDGARRAETYVALSGIADLAGVSVDGELRAGALATHTELARAGLDGALAVIGEAAARSAFPAIRNVATLGGNLGARPFPEADLVPALLAASAQVRLAGPSGETRVAVDEYLATRDERPAGELIAGVVVPAPAGRRSAYERLTILGGGEYAVASVAISVDVTTDGTVGDARVALGCVEDVARLSSAAAEALIGQELGDAAATRCGTAAADGANPRDGLDAPGWYRTAVLPALVRRAMRRMIDSQG